MHRRCAVRACGDNVIRQGDVPRFVMDQGMKSPERNLSRFARMLRARLLELLRFRRYRLVDDMSDISPNVPGIFGGMLSLTSSGSSTPCRDM